MKTIRQKHNINATVEEVYTALTNPLTIELWSGYTAEMSKVPGSEFSLYEGDIVGRNLEFAENEMLKQEWYFGDENPPSIVTIRLRAIKDKTEVELIHDNVPDDEYDEMVTGWRRHYFGALKKYF